MVGGGGYFHAVKHQGGVMSTLQKHGGIMSTYTKISRGNLSGGYCLYPLRHLLILKQFIFISIICNDTLNTCVSKEASMRA